jgi:hypothetical protein
MEVLMRGTVIVLGIIATLYIVGMAVHYGIKWWDAHHPDNGPPMTGE